LYGGWEHRGEQNETWRQRPYLEKLVSIAGGGGRKINRRWCRVLISGGKHWTRVEKQVYKKGGKTKKNGKPAENDVRYFNKKVWDLNQEWNNRDFVYAGGGENFMVRKKAGQKSRVEKEGLLCDRGNI